MALLGLIGCSADEPAVSRSAPVDSVQGVVDSIFPVEEEIRRFKAAHGTVPAGEPVNAPASRDALVERFADALEQRDTAALSALSLNDAEFIDFYFPTSIYSRPPYKQSPEITYLLLRQQGDKGLRRVVERFGGSPAGIQGYSCNGAPRVEGGNRFWDGCTIEWSHGRDTPGPARLFGSIIERQGRFKFVSYANDL